MDMAHIMWKRMACRFKKQDNRVDISELIMNDLTEDNDIRKLGKKVQCTVNTSGESYKLQVTCVCFWLLRE